MTDLAIAGFPLRIEYGEQTRLDPRDVQRLLALLASGQGSTETMCSPRPPRPPLTLSFEPPRPRAQGGRELWNKDGLRAMRFEDDTLVLESDGASIEVAPQASLVRFSPNRRWASLDDFTRLQLISYGLLALLRARNCYDLHAAVVQSPSGEGWLLVGPSGSGKTTLTRAFVDAGFSYGSDDVVGIEIEGPEHVRVWPLRRALGVPTHPQGRSPKLLATPEEIGIEREIACVRADVLVLPSIAGIDKTQVEFATARSACLAVIANLGGVLLDPSCAQRQMDAAALLSTRTRRLRILLGTDALTHRGLAVRLLQETLSITK